PAATWRGSLIEATNGAPAAGRRLAIPVALRRRRGVPASHDEGRGLVLDGERRVAEGGTRDAFPEPEEGARDEWTGRHRPEGGVVEPGLPPDVRGAGGFRPRSAPRPGP